MVGDFYMLSHQASTHILDHIVFAAYKDWPFHIIYQHFFSILQVLTRSSMILSIKKTAAGVIPFADCAIQLADEMNSRLKIRHNSPRTSALRRDKYLQQEGQQVQPFRNQKFFG